MIRQAFTIWHIGSNFESASQELAQEIEFTNEYRLGTYDDIDDCLDELDDRDDLDQLFIELHYIDEDLVDNDTTDLYDAFYQGSDYDTAENFLNDNRKEA